MSKPSARSLLAEVGLAPRGLSREEKLARFGFLPTGSGLMTDEDIEALNRNYLTEKETAEICCVTRKTLRMLVETGRISAPIRYLTGNIWKRASVDAALAKFAPAVPPEKDGSPLSWECVYFVQGGAMTKIGWAQNAKLRLIDLQAGSPVPLTIVAALPGGSLRQEQALHKHFAKYRRHGEWFDLPPFWKEHVGLGGHVVFLGKRQQYSLKPRRK